MLKRVKGNRVIAKRRRTQPLHVPTISLFEKKLFIDTDVFKQAIMCHFLSRGDLAAVVRTCKAGIIAMYALTAVEGTSRYDRGMYVEWRLERLLLQLTGDKSLLVAAPGKTGVCAYAHHQRGCSIFACWTCWCERAAD